MGVNETDDDRINAYGAVRIGLASPDDIRSRSSGEISDAGIINQPTDRPALGGLFCEAIFGTGQDRSKRMGHIELAAPVVHVWFFNAMPSQLGTLLDMRMPYLKKIIYFSNFVVIAPGATPLTKGQLLTEDEYNHARTLYGDAFEAGIGAEAIKKLLEQLNLVELSRQLRAELVTLPRNRRAAALAKRLRLVEALRDSGLNGPANRPEWMVLECIPVIPPDLRPIRRGDRRGEINELYRRVISRNNRLRKLMTLHAPLVIIRNEKRMLQQAVDALFDNLRCRRPVIGHKNRPLMSLSDRIRWRRFDVSLFGKRVDYSARSVIVPSPALKLHQCGLPKKIALELFQPLVIRRLMDLEEARSIEEAKTLIERREDATWSALADVMNGHPVLLNRTPTLLRERIQAFEPLLVEGNAIQIHPLVCKTFNVKFDGRQMRVYLPLSIEARIEANVLMASANNLFSPANGDPMITPSQDIVLGCCYLTADPLQAFVSPAGVVDERIKDYRKNLPENLMGEGMIFSSPAEVFLAYALKKVGIHARIKVRLPSGKRVMTEVAVNTCSTKVAEIPRHPQNLRVGTTVGRVIFNEILNPHMPFYDLALSDKHLSRIIADCFHELGRRETIDLLDRMKEVGFRAVTRSGLSLAAADLRTPDKATVLRNTELEVEKTARQYFRGIICDMERFNKIIDLWTNARDTIGSQMLKTLREEVRDGVPYLNPVFLMAHSGAGGGGDEIRKLAGMPGLGLSSSGQISETPIKANMREGLSIPEYLMTIFAARQSRMSVAIHKPADTAHLLRKLIDVAGNVVITMHDCGTPLGITKRAVHDNEIIKRSLSESIHGRVICHRITDGRTGEIIARGNEMITSAQARRIEKLGIDNVLVRSPMTCAAPRGVCRLCYGIDLATGVLVEEGMAVGVVAAQSMNTIRRKPVLRSSLVASEYPRMSYVVEHRARRFGTVKFIRITVLTNDDGQTIGLSHDGQIAIMGYTDRILEEYSVPHGSILKVKDGEPVHAHQVLCNWDPHNTPTVAERPGQVHFEDINAGETLLVERAPSGAEHWVIGEHRGERHPRLIIKDDRGQSLEVHYLPEKTRLEVRAGEQVSAGRVLARTPRAFRGTRNSTGKAIPSLVDYLEARRPHDPAVIADSAGRIRVGHKRRGQRSVIIEAMNEDGQPLGIEREQLVPQAKELLFGSGDYVKAGEPLVSGPLVPHDLLSISGVEAVQAYLLSEMRDIFRRQRVDIDDKHIELVIAQMLRRVKIENAGDTGLMAGMRIDKFALREINDRLAECVKIQAPGDSSFETGALIGKGEYNACHDALVAVGKRPPNCELPTPAQGSIELEGITRAASQSDSFLCAVSIRELTGVLTEAALAGRIDCLAGLKENVILGRLVPVGTGYPRCVEIQVDLAGSQTPRPSSASSK